MSKIIGNTVGTTMLRPNWAETDEKSSAYIGNKPTADDGNFLVGNGEGNLREMTPAEVLSHINGASVSTLTTAEYDALVEAEETNANVLYVLTDTDEEEYALKSDLDNYAKTSDIPSVAGLASTDYVDTKVAGIVNSAPEALNTLNELASALGNDENFATTVAQQIGEKADKEHEHSEYITETELANKKYLSEVKPEDVIFDIDLVTTYAMGNYSLTNGMATIPTKDKNLKEVWDMIYQKELQPTVTQPSYTFTAYGGSGEVGTTFTLPTATFKVTSVGSYSYNDTGIKFSGSIASGNNTKSFSNLVKDGTATVQAAGSNTYTDSEITFSFSGKYSYNAGATPLTNLGNTSTKSAIAAVTDKTISTSCTFTGYRKMFVGCITSTKSSFTPAEVRAFDRLTDYDGNGIEASRSEKSFTVPSSTKQIVVAYPASLTSNTATKPTFKYEALGQWFTEDSGNIAYLGTANVEGANGVTATTYYLYSYTHSGTFASDTNYKIEI